MTPPRRRTHNSTHGVSETRRPEPAPARALSTRAALPDAPVNPAAPHTRSERPTTLPTQRPRGAVGVPRSVHTATLWAALRHTRNPFTRRGLAARALARASRPLPRRLRLRQDTAVQGSPLHSPAPLGQAQTRKPTKVSTGSAPPRARPAPHNGRSARAARAKRVTHTSLLTHTHTECSPREERNADSNITTTERDRAAHQPRGSLLRVVRRAARSHARRPGGSQAERWSARP